MKRGKTGIYEPTVAGGKKVRAFVPARLPPVPSISLAGKLERTLEAAVLALGDLLSEPHYQAGCPLNCASGCEASPLPVSSRQIPSATA